MKKFLRLFIVLLIVTCTFLLASCDFSFGNGSINNDATKTPLSASMYNKNRNVVTRAEEIDNCEYDLVASYQSGNYYIFQFYLGYVEFVPLQEVDCWYWNANSEYEKTLTTETTTTEEIKEASSDMISDTTYDSWTGVSSLDVSVGVETGFKTALQTCSTKMTAELNVGYSQTRNKGNDNTKTASYSYENASSNSQTSIKSETYKFDTTCPAGWYRLVYMGCFDIFTMVVIDLRDNTYSINNSSYLYRVGSCLDYCENSRFPSNSENDLTFDISYLDNLVIPEDAYELLPGDNDGNVIDKPITDTSGSITTGDGTSNNPYLIYNRQDFIKMMQTSESGVYYKLMEDLDLGDWKEYGFISAKSFTGIGYGFKGNFDGNNHTITYTIEGENLSNNSEYDFYYALFPAVIGGSISNLNVETSIYIVGGTAHCEGIGGIAGICQNATFKYCTVSGRVDHYNIKAPEGYVMAGGIAAAAIDNTSFVYCTNNADIYSYYLSKNGKKAFAGGITNARGNTSCNGCINRGSVNASGNNTDSLMYWY